MNYFDVIHVDTVTNRTIQHAQFRSELSFSELEKHARWIALKLGFVDTGEGEFYIQNMYLPLLPEIQAEDILGRPNEFNYICVSTRNHETHFCSYPSKTFESFCSLMKDFEKADKGNFKYYTPSRHD